MQALSDRTASFTDSVIRRMTRISNQYGAVNLSQGFPDFDPPKPILDRLSQVAYEDYHQYSITWGAQDFREALAKKQSHFMGRDIDPNGEIVVTCGSTEAMMAAMMTVANPGDKVVIFSPFYENYSADTILSGAVPIYVPLTPPSFTFDPEVLEDAFRQHPKALVLCNPSNPCGKVFTREELEIIGLSAITGKMITLTGIPQQVTNALMTVTDSKIVFLILVNIMLLVAGMFMETNSAILLLGPILIPVANAYGVSTLHFASIMLLNMEIGMITPPMAGNLFVGARLADCSIDKLLKDLVPFFALAVGVLIFTTYVPDAIVWLPKLLGCA